MTDVEETTKPRTLVLCFDGTASQYDADNTNVVRFYSLLRRDDPDSQLCYYQAGVGTYFAPGVVSPLLEWWAEILDDAFAWYLDAHVMDGYKFLMQYYRTGDKICLFGFSRGAYTARALAGFLHKIGLLSRGNEQQISFAYKLYTRTNAAGLALCAGFKKTFCQNVKIEFVGVWDTVASVGIVTTQSLPFVNSNKAIRTFRHALSLDERRFKFEPNTYHRRAPDAAGAKHDPEHASGPVRSQSTSEQQPLKKKSFSIFRSRQVPLEIEAEEGLATDVLEIWFAGCHSDVGGGSVPNDTKHNLGNITLRWMVQETIASQCGILFDEEALCSIGIPGTASPATSEDDTTVNKLDVIDAVQPLFDQLVLNKLWWIVEVLPFKFYWQDVDGRWHRQIRINLGRGRMITNERHPKFHITVKERMADKSLSYQPKASWKKGTEVYVE